MAGSGDAPDGHRPGDKVRVRKGPDAGQRGVLRDVAADRLAVLLEDGRALVLGGDEFTNFSLAARRAWRTMPKRAGRPRSANPTRRPISVRLDLDVWRDLVRAAELGLIESRDRTINAWVRERLDGLLRKTAPGRRRQHVGGAD